MRQIVVSTLMTLLVSVLLSSCNLDSLASVADETIGDSFESTENSGRDSLCPTGSVINDTERQSAESRILSATVRIYVESWSVKADESGYEVDNKVAHATVMDGRYLVTHNHFSRTPGTEMASEELTMVRVRTLQGQPLLDLPLAEVSIVAEDEQALILDLGEQGATVLQTIQGAQSAVFANCNAAEIQPGTAVAQIDWDGEATRVDWTTVTEVQMVDGAARIVLADGVMPGASGGGVFVNGQHVANNWTLMQMTAEDGQVLGEASSAALNTTQIVSASAETL